MDMIFAYIKICGLELSEILANLSNWGHWWEIQQDNLDLLEEAQTY